MSTVTVETTAALVTVEHGELVVTPEPTTVTVEVAAVGLQGPAGQGVPVGGLTGEALVKTSATDYVTAWGVPSEASVRILASAPVDGDWPAPPPNGRLALHWDGAAATLYVRAAGAWRVLSGGGPPPPTPSSILAGMAMGPRGLTYSVEY